MFFRKGINQKFQAINQFNQFEFVIIVLIHYNLTSFTEKLSSFNVYELTKLLETE